MDHPAIIVALGGYAQVARLLGVHYTVAWRWQEGRRPIPPSRWHWVLATCRRNRVSGVTLDGLQSAYDAAMRAQRAGREPGQRHGRKSSRKRPARSSRRDLQAAA